MCVYFQCRWFHVNNCRFCFVSCWTGIKICIYIFVIHTHLSVHVREYVYWPQSMQWWCAHKGPGDGGSCLLDLGVRRAALPRHMPYTTAPLYPCTVEDAPYKYCITQTYSTHAYHIIIMKTPCNIHAITYTCSDLTHTMLCHSSLLYLLSNWELRCLLSNLLLYIYKANQMVHTYLCILFFTCFFSGNF